mgnify:CR=1 FL=1
MVTFSDDISAKSSLYVERFRYLKNSLCLYTKLSYMKGKARTLPRGLILICSNMIEKNLKFKKKYSSCVWRVFAQNVSIALIRITCLNDACNQYAHIKLSEFLKWLDQIVSICFKKINYINEKSTLGVNPKVLF